MSVSTFELLLVADFGWQWQVGVYAPGTAKMTTFRPFVLSAMETGAGPSAPNSTSVASGSVSPCEMVMKHAFLLFAFEREGDIGCGAETDQYFQAGDGQGCGMWLLSGLGRPERLVSPNCETMDLMGASR